VKCCQNDGNFPVLAGDEKDRDMLLCSPIVLYDYPKIAPESAGDFYDATEMDEMLTLRVMTLTDQEKNEMGEADDRVRNLLRRTEESAREQLMKTHGTIRGMRPTGGSS
jgi:hydrogenase maturation protease